MNRAPSLLDEPRATVSWRLPRSWKQRLAQLAGERRVPVAALCEQALLEYLERGAAGSDRVLPRDEHAADRLSINLHLRPGDRAALRRRAAGRGVRLATYVVLLARGHLRAAPVIPQHELVALKAALGEVGRVRRELRAWRSAAPAGCPASPPDPSTATAQTCRELAERVDALEDALRAYIATAMHAWESSSD